MLKIAHRGAKLQATENTLLAFEKAIEAGADMVELDFHITKDGHLVVIHDPTLDRTTNGTGFIHDLTLKEIENFRTKDGQKIPTLKEVYELCKGKIQVLTEIKTTDACEKLASLTQKNGMSEQVVIQSFLHGELLAYRKYDSTTRTAILLDELLAHPKILSTYLNSLQANGVNMKFSGMYPETAQVLHEHGQFVYAWGVGEHEMEQARSMEIDGMVVGI